MNVKKDKSTSVTTMPFAVTSKDHTVAIANKDSLAMDSIAHVRKRKKQFMLTLCCTSIMCLLFSLKAFDLCVLLVHDITNDDNDDVYVISILMS